MCLRLRDSQKPGQPSLGEFSIVNAELSLLNEPTAKNVEGDSVWHESDSTLK
jgi:hypothetical protein